MPSEQKRGRPAKYGQPTVRVSVRLPADMVAAIDAFPIGMGMGDRSAKIVAFLRFALPVCRQALARL